MKAKSSSNFQISKYVFSIIQYMYHSHTSLQKVEKMHSTAITAHEGFVLETK